MASKTIAAAQKALEEVSRLGQEIDQMDIPQLEATIKVVAEIGRWAWIIQTQALLRLMSLREKLVGGRGHHATPGSGYEEFLDEWAGKINKSKSWIRTNMQIIRTFGTHCTLLSPGHETNPRQTYCGSEVTIDDDEMFRVVDFDGGREVYHIEFTPHPGLRRAHYEAMLPAPDPKALMTGVISELADGETITATEIRRRVRDARLEAQGLIRVHVDMSVELRRRLSALARRAKLGEQDVLIRALALLEADLDKQEMPVAA